MTRPLDVNIIDLCASRTRRKNVIVILITEGGDADPAYRIARSLQEYYNRFSVFVSGYCKSAGTLLALGAHEIIMADCGELGPLDVQIYKEDEMGATRSGLTILSALSTLQVRAFDAFEYFLLETKKRSNGFITTRTAIRVASELSSSLFAPIFEHVDAMHIGEAGRSLRIAHSYGELLLESSQNCKPHALNRLTSSYPSHGFIIDRFQANTLFNNVRGPNAAETVLAQRLGDASREPIPKPEHTLLCFLNAESSVSASDTDDATEQTEPSTGNNPTHVESDGGPGPNVEKVEPVATARPSAVRKRRAG